MKNFYINLQLFAGEKTEKATPKRRQEARKKGQVLKSQELNSVIIFLIGFLLLKYLLPNILRDLQLYIQSLWSKAFIGNLTIETIFPILIEGVYLTFKLLLPILLLVMVGGITVNLVQVGFLFTTESIQIKLSKINPLEGLKRIFSKKSLMELIKSVFKIGVVSYLAFTTIKPKLQEFPYLMDKSILVIITYVGELLFTILWKVIIFLFFLAIVDYIYQKYEYENSLKMSKQEIKDEYKNIEGDPQVKGKIKERQRQMAMNRMMQEIPQADVIITNPTHFAVAIKYNPETMDAPVVIGKGQDLVALRIKEIAKEKGIITVENKPLAQMLYKTVDINEKIPEEFFQAVAEVLAYVYRLRGKG